MDQASALGVSAIICTRNRAVSLARTLQTMAELELGSDAKFELIVVDNGSSDQTPQVVEQFVALAPFPVRYVPEPRPGLSAARNRGIKSSAGDLILFTDDDCLVAKDWVTAALRAFAGKPLQVIGGRVDLHNPQHLPITIRTAPDRATLRSVNDLFGFAIGANLTFGRAVVEQIGWFDEMLGPGSPAQSADDTDFVFRALIHGIPVSYDPALQVRHDHGRTGQADFYRLMNGYSIGTGALLAKWLLRGNTQLVRPVYWDVRSGFRAWRRGEQSWRHPLMKMAFVTGIWRHLLGTIRQRR
jgi:glycosyltransferase involved in cell wall biosynthesis